MRTDDFDYHLPQGHIAQTPIEPRDASRLMICHRTTDAIEHKVFRDVVDYLEPGDTLVVNDSRVMPARLIGRKAGTGGAAELLLLRRLNLATWEALARPGARLKPGTVVEFGGTGYAAPLRAAILDHRDDGLRTVTFTWDEGASFERLLDRLGETPLPPYIREKLSDPERYQCVYSARTGSAAAPTAGLHFTQELLKRVEDKGVNIARVMLHVGLGTFRPVESDDVTSHHMHAEYYELSPNTASLINHTKAAGHRVVCVGTTSVRVVESAAVTPSGGMPEVKPSSGWTSIYIYPGYRYNIVDGIITNFHLPRSTLLMLVSAFWSREAVLAAYQTAISEGYRFYSFGDAMMIV